MIGKRRMILAALVALVVVPAWAQEGQEEPVPGDTPAPAEETPAAPTPEEPKKSFWGDRNALFLEVLGGSSGLQDLNTSVLTTTALDSVATLSIDKSSYARGTVGWQLPARRGGFLLSYTGYREDEYELNAFGRFAGTEDPSVVEPTENLVWWHLQVKDGQLVATLTPPAWTPPFQMIDPETGLPVIDPVTGQPVLNPGDDANGNNFPDPEEVRYSDPAAVIRSTVPSSLDNATQAFDLTYTRGFGGRRVAGRWSAGARYFQYEGNAAVPAWLAIAPQGVYTDGSVLRPMSFRQESSGFGPTGTGEVLTYFFRRRLNLYALARVAFVLNSLESDTGETFSLAFDAPQNLLVPADLRLHRDLDKNSWQSGFEIGARFQILEGFRVMAGYHIDSYQDVVLLPDRLNIPARVEQVNLGSTATYTTQDLRYDGWFAGASYQF